MLSKRTYVRKEVDAQDEQGEHEQATTSPYNLSDSERLASPPKIRAIAERTDVSALLCRLAEVPPPPPLGTARPGPIACAALATNRPR